MNTPAPATPDIPLRNLAAIDAADLALDLIDNCVTPLAKAISHLPAGDAQIAPLCLLLQQQATEYRDLFELILDREQR